MPLSTTVLITGGAGFIGSALVREVLARREYVAINVDKLTYAGNLDSLAAVLPNERHHFERADICDRGRMEQIFSKYRPEAVIHLAAESHVDRSVDGAADFIQTNIVGTYTLLEAARAHWGTLGKEAKQRFRFLHVSTDEVFGSLGLEGSFVESTPYDPRSPYSASKASSDHLVRAWHHTYGLPVLITNCSNNYGPYQFPEKLIPVVILRALAGRPIPVYGRGENVRDWLYVEDHIQALLLVLERGAIGETYNIGGRNEKSNLRMVHTICEILDEFIPMRPLERHASLIEFVSDRPGHDFRYAIDSIKIERELGWVPRQSLASGLRKTVEWYLSNHAWCDRVLSANYRLESLGLGDAQS